jgi:hypothetical protein
MKYIRSPTVLLILLTYDYTYQVIEKLPSNKLKCRFYDRPVKTDNPDADFEVYRDF